MTKAIKCELSIPTKAIVLKGCSIDLVQDNNNLYCIKNLLSFLTKDYIGVNKYDILLLRNLMSNEISHITI